MSTEIIMDIVLAGGVIILAWLSLSVRRVFTAIVFFVSLGLLVTVIWARLNAWDVAIAEAAIGAGLTGALLLVAWRQLRDETAAQPGESNDVS